MHFEIGKRVAVLDDVLKGVIISIEGEVIGLEDHEGMVYYFKKKELVIIDIDQHELSKFSDIENPILKDKIQKQEKKKPVFLKEKKEVVFEVDLHIHQLTDGYKRMDNYDMLSLQIDTAKRKLEFAISKRFSKVVFIHGVGEGVLKSELHFLLNKYSVDYYDASYQKYGLGATEVYIYQNPKS